MSDDEGNETAASDVPAEQPEPGLAKRLYRTVTPAYRNRPDVEMNTIGWAMLLGLVLILLPLLPLYAVVWVVSKVLEALRPH